MMLPVKRKLINIIRYMPEEKLNRLVKIADEMNDELTPEDIAAIEEGEAQIARGESISLSELRKRYGL